MFWRVIEETGRRHGQLESWGQPPSPHAGRGADVWFLEAPLPTAVKGTGYSFASMSGMLDLSRDEKARVGRLRPRRRAVNRAAVRPDGYHVGKLAFRRKVAGNVRIVHFALRLSRRSP